MKSIFEALKKWAEPIHWVLTECIIQTLYSLEIYHEGNMVLVDETEYVGMQEVILSQKL